MPTITHRTICYYSFTLHFIQLPSLSLYFYISLAHSDGSEIVWNLERLLSPITFRGVITTHGKSTHLWFVISLFAHHARANCFFIVWDEERRSKRVRGPYITQHRLRSSSTRSLEVKDIPWKNVNRGKVTNAIPHQLIHIHGAGAGLSQSKVWMRKEKQKLINNLIFEELINRERVSGRISEDPMKRFIARAKG